MEAQLCGTPVITYASGGCVESAGKEGIIVSKGDIEAVKEALSNIKPITIRDTRVDKSVSLENYQLLFGGGIGELRNNSI